MRRSVWAGQARCGNDPEAFHKASDNGKRDICDACPVKAMCRDYAILHEEYEFFGGMTPAERKLARSETDPKYLGLVLRAVTKNELEPHHMVPWDLLTLFRSINVTPAPKEQRSGLMEPGQPLSDFDLADLGLDDLGTSPEPAPQTARKFPALPPSGFDLLLL